MALKRSLDCPNRDPTAINEENGGEGTAHVQLLFFYLGCLSGSFSNGASSSFCSSSNDNNNNDDEDNNNGIATFRKDSRDRQSLLARVKGREIRFLAVLDSLLPFTQEVHVASRCAHSHQAGAMYEVVVHASDYVVAFLRERRPRIRLQDHVYVHIQHCRIGMYVSSMHR